jgi:hypothetical protein
MREGMREQLMRSPLMDAAQYTRALENLCRHAWCEWLEVSAEAGS